MDAEAKKAYLREYYQKNRERLRAQQAIYNEANREKLREWHKAYYENNKELRQEGMRRFLARNPEYRKQYNDVYYAANKPRYVSNARARKIKKGRATVSWADQAKIKTFYDAAARLTRDTGIPHEVDHIVPLNGKNVSGLHVEYNPQVLTKAQNNAKRNRF